ncbi:MAG: glycoside hydrolase family protein [Planctomycetota bacterium]
MSNPANLSKSDFMGRLEPIGRVLEDPDYNVWCCSPILGEDGRVHLFYARWPNAADHMGWVTVSEIAHAVADSAEGSFVTTGTVLAGRGGDHWDAHTIHNPAVFKIDGGYVMYYIGNREPNVETLRTGAAFAESLDGPWERMDEPLIPGGDHPDDLDSAYACNPVMARHPDGRYLLYYQGMSLTEWEHDLDLRRRKPETGMVGTKANRRGLLATATDPRGPYTLYPGNPIIDLNHYGNHNPQCEDPTVWFEDGKFHMLARDMGVVNHEVGLYFTSDDGVNWSDPQLGFEAMSHYVDEAANGLDREGRMERPQVLLGKDGRPTHLFGAFRGGRYNTSSAFVFRIKR